MAIKLILALALIGGLGAGFKWYTDFIAEAAIRLQASADEIANLQAANASYIEAMEWLSKDVQAKQAQLSQLSKEYELIDSSVEGLQKQLETVNEDYRICSAMVIPKPVYDSVFHVLSKTGSARTVDRVSESLPVSGPLSVEPGQDVGKHDRSRP